MTTFRSCTAAAPDFTFPLKAKEYLKQEEYNHERNNA